MPNADGTLTEREQLAVDALGPQGGGMPTLAPRTYDFDTSGPLRGGIQPVAGTSRFVPPMLFSKEGWGPTRHDPGQTFVSAPERGAPPPVAPVAPAAAPPSVTDRAIAAVTPPPATTVQAEAKAALAPKAAPAMGGGGGYGGGFREHKGALTDAGRVAQSRALDQGIEQTILTDTLEGQAQAAAERQGEREQRQAQHQQLVDEQLQTLQSAVHDASSTPDFGRLMRSPEGVVMAIGAALGGGAASRVNGRNPGQDALDSALARDFASLKAEAESKGERVGRQANLVQQMRSVFADREQGDLAAEMAHKEAAAKQIEILGAQSKIGEIRDNAKLAAAKLRDDVATLNDRFNAAAAGAATHQQARADKERDFALRVYEAETKRAEATGKAGERAQASGEKLSAALQGVAKSETAADRATTDIRKGGTVVNSNPVANWFAEAHPAMYKAIAGDDAAAAQQSFTSFKSAMFAEISGAAISESEKSRLELAIQGAGTPEAKLLALKNAKEVIEASKARVKAGYDPEVVSTYERREAGIRPTQGATNVRFTPGVK